MRPATETAANAGASHTELRSHAPDRTRRRERGSAGRRRGWTVLKIVAMLIIGGLVLFAVGFAWMTTADIDTTFWTLVCMVMLSRLGLAYFIGLCVFFYKRVLSR